MFDKIMEISLLYDFYGQLLPAKQKAFLALYHEENYSLAEIAQEFGISRQGVHDGVKKAERALHDFEEKLGLVAKFQKTEAGVAKIEALVDQLLELYQADGVLVKKLTDIKNTIDNLA